MTVTMCEYAPRKHELFSYSQGDDGNIKMTVIDPAARAFGQSVLTAPMRVGDKWIKANDDPAAWLSALPLAYAGSRVQAHITER